jgi:Replication-relaxation
MVQQPLLLTDTDEEILLSLSRYYYLTAAQISRLLFPDVKDDNRRSQRRLKLLSDAGYVLRLRALATPQYGSAPYVFTLGKKGRQYVARAGVPTPTYFRPSEEQEKARNNAFMLHTLATTDVLIAVERLCRQYPVSLEQLLIERELKAHRVYVDMPIEGEPGRTRKAAVIPDAWFQVSVAGGPALSISLELDRGTQDQKAWRQKVHALALWATGPYQQAFQTDNLTIAVAAPTPERRVALRTWTQRELEQQQMSDLADIFLFTAASPVSTEPARFFFGRLWYPPHESRPVSLFDAPVAREQEVFTQHV